MHKFVVREKKKETRMSLSGGAIAGIVVGSVVVFLLVLYVFVRWHTWRRANRIDPRMPRVAVDPHEYAGKWYEIAAYPTWFEAGCVNSTARYIPERNHMKVINRCYRNGHWEESIGRAHQTDHDGVFAVDFFPGIYGNYTVTYRDRDTAMVTNTDRTTLWILSRHEEISDAKKNKLLHWLQQHKFDTERLKFTQRINFPDPDDQIRHR